MNKKIRVLQIVDSLGRGGGVINVVLNWHRNIDKNKIQFDYLYTLKLKDSLKKEIENLGGKVYCLDYRGVFHLCSFLKNIYKFFRNHRYNTIHSHITHLNLFFYPLAKIFGTKNIIQHAHGIRWSDKKLNGWRNYLMLHTVWFLITKKLACSEKSGQFWFGKNFTLINNGIDLDKFDYKSFIRENKRKELGLENNFVLGHVGRLSNEKNHRFFIDVFENLIILDPSARLILVGTGPLEKQIKHYAEGKGLQDKILFLGMQENVNEMYQVFDVFCLPSLHEGMPIVAIEAQCSGLPCLFSDAITKEVLIIPNTRMLSLTTPTKIWAEQIFALKGNKRWSGVQYLKNYGFDIKDNVRQIEEIYGAR